MKPKNIKYEFLPFGFLKGTQDKWLTEQIFFLSVGEKTWNWISVGVEDLHWYNMFHILEFMCLSILPHSKFWYTLHRPSGEIGVKLDLWSLRIGSYDVLSDWIENQMCLSLFRTASLKGGVKSEKCIYVLIDSKLLWLALLLGNAKYNHALIF